MNNDSTVSRQWAARPDDERFLSLGELATAVRSRRINSRTASAPTRELATFGTEQGEIIIRTPLGPKFFSNWSFGQISAVAGAPAGYLKRLPAPLAASCINHGLLRAERANSLLLTNGHDNLRACTSETYGRIWDVQVVDAVQRVADGTSWQVPASSYATKQPKRATTLYASDRDVFLFLVDPDHPVDLPGVAEPLFRGFYAWNSETGAQTFGLATFLYQSVCDNRIIWGVSHRSELRIRHTGGAPDRFVSEGRRTLLDYTNESTAPIVERIRRAQAVKVGDNDDEVKTFLRKHNLTIAQADMAIENAKQEGKDPRNAWSITEGLTAAARSIPHTDERVRVERTAGSILDEITK
jgi:hypothetical protein